MPFLVEIIFFCHNLFLSQMEMKEVKAQEKVEKYIKRGLIAYRTYYKKLADTQKLVDFSGKYDFINFA